MKVIILISLLIFTVSCKSKKQLSSKTLESQEITLCPEDGLCSYELLTNKAIALNKDNLGAFYPKIVDGNDLVLKFEYKKNELKNIQDNSYREEIFIELDLNNIEIHLKNLSSSNVIFARWCYCKGQTGYYKINEGELQVKQLKDKTYHLMLSFKVEEVPQVITKIEHIFTLE